MAVGVLIVDDDVAILQTLSGILRFEAVDVATAMSAREAVEQLRKKDFDLVITDMRMETATAGAEVIRAAMMRPARPVVIVLSAYPLSGTDLGGTGASGILMKGSDPFALIRELRSILTAIKRKNTDPEGARVKPHDGLP
jgi:CheY-like chemotaxis protein